jgi:hypothetical protein
MRIVFRIGGSVVASPVDTALISKYVELLKALRTLGHEVVVVVGGGGLAREFIGMARKLGLEIQAQDELAISVSRLFAQLFLKKFGDAACGKVALTLDDAAECLSQGKIVEACSRSKFWREMVILVVEDDPYGALYFEDSATAEDTRPIKADGLRYHAAAPIISALRKSGTVKSRMSSPRRAKRRPPRTSIIRPKNGRTEMATTLWMPMMRPTRLCNGPNRFKKTGSRKKSETDINRKK